MNARCKQPFRRRLAAFLFLSPPVVVAAEKTPQQPFLNRYHPSTDVDSLASLDLDQRSIVARLAGGNYAGLREAEEIYSSGRLSTSGKLPTDAEKNRTTLQGLSTNAEEVMGAASTYAYETFVDYYGSHDYADKWIQAAFDGIATEFDDGDADFSKLDIEGRIAAIRYGTLVLNVWMGVIGRIEVAANLCWEIGASDVLLAEWDRAVALYTGSLARADGENGHFLYTLARIQCAKFGTCGEEATAPVNDEVFSLFGFGKAHLEDGDCKRMGENAKDVTNLMAVPLVQGLLHAAYALDVEGDYRPATRGEGAAFAASLLPLLDDCNSGNADAVRNDLMPGKATSGSFEVVKAALERSYECLGIACADVGGILNVRGDGYARGAEACGNVQPVVSDSDQSEKGDQSEKDDESEKEDGDLDDDHLLRYENDYFMGDEPQSSEPEGDILGGMDAHDAALLSGVIFGIVGFLGGACIVAACKSRSGEKKAAEVEFVTSSAPTPGATVFENVASSNTNENGAGNENIAPLGINEIADKHLFV